MRILPEVTEVGSGYSLVNRIREVDIGDLLGRDVVAPDLKLLGQSISKRNVLVTGAGGSIGKAGAGTTRLGTGKLRRRTDTGYSLLGTLKNLALPAPDRIPRT